MKTFKVVVYAGIVNIVERMLHHNISKVPMLNENGTDRDHVTNTQSHKGAPKLV